MSDQKGSRGLGAIAPRMCPARTLQAANLEQIALELVASGEMGGVVDFAGEVQQGTVAAVDKIGRAGPARGDGNDDIDCCDIADRSSADWG